MPTCCPGHVLNKSRKQRKHACLEIRSKHRCISPFMFEPFSRKCLGQNEGLPEIFKTSLSHFRNIPYRKHSFVFPTYFVLFLFNVLKSVTLHFQRPYAGFIFGCVFLRFSDRFGHSLFFQILAM